MYSHEKTTIVLIAVAVVFPFVLLFWPFAQWNNTVSLTLRIIPSITAQMLFCKIGTKIIKVIPAILTGIFAVWGTYLYLTSPHWANATFIGLISDYVSPFICCVIVLTVHLFQKKKTD